MTTVTIMRPRHPLQGHRLAVLGRMRRHGRLELLVVLPDGSKTLVPAAWTDLDTSDAQDQDPAAGGQAAAVQARAATLGTLTDLGQAVELVRALSTRRGQTQEQAARPSPSKEEDRAAHPAQSAPRPDTDATPARPAAPRADDGGDQPAGRPDRQSRRPHSHRGRR